MTEHLWTLYEATHGEDQRRYEDEDDREDTEVGTVQCDVCNGEGCPVCDHTGRVEA